MTTLEIFRLMKMVSWVVFIGLCIKSGSIILIYILSIFSVSASYFFLEMNFPDLYKFGFGYFSLMMGFLIVISVLKAWIFYLILKISTDTNIQYPFTQKTARIILHISYVVFTVGILAIAGNIYSMWLAGLGLEIPLTDLDHYFGARNEFILLAAVLFVIAQVFKRGVEIQSENELTI